MASRKTKVPKTAVQSAKPLLRKMTRIVNNETKIVNNATRIVNKEINSSRGGAGQRPVRVN